MFALGWLALLGSDLLPPNTEVLLPVLMLALLEVLSVWRVVPICGWRVVVLAAGRFTTVLLPLKLGFPAGVFMSLPLFTVEVLVAAGRVVGLVAGLVMVPVDGLTTVLLSFTYGLSIFPEVALLTVLLLIVAGVVVVVCGCTLLFPVRGLVKLPLRLSYGRPWLVVPLAIGRATFRLKSL